MNPVKSKYESHCKTCFEPVTLNDLIVKEPWGWVHYLCQGQAKPQCDAISGWTGMPCGNPPKFGQLCTVHHKMELEGKVFPRGAVMV